jgi:acyl-CoA ligase (AMP-forming) (exosortase A-associated)
MTELIHELAVRQAMRRPDHQALRLKAAALDYGALAEAMHLFASSLIELGLQRQERVAIFLPKQFETVIAMFGTAAAGCVFVPVNPLLKPTQVEHIVNDCNVRVLVTSPERLAALIEILPKCPDLRHLIVVGDAAVSPALPSSLNVAPWSALLSADNRRSPHRVIDVDMAAILYTSGSTGKPKGVVLSHRNMVTGAHSVARYLENTPEDRLLAVLPFSFDYGFSQLSTAFHVGANVVLLDYLVPRDVLKALVREHITGLAGVPPLWVQLAELEWPATITEHLRYITNSGGAMPRVILDKLRAALPRTKPFLMYGLTEAFRSTYLPPAEVDRRPDSMGKAIPNAEILVVRPDGTPCAPNEPGELVHRGSLVALGYWNDPQKTAERFKPLPSAQKGLVLTEIAVWSGDTVRMDEEGFLYFIGRSDEMIKSSGYRVSPTEVEEVAFATGLVADAAAIGVPHPALGQAVVIVVTPAPGKSADKEALLEAFRKELPMFMVPHHVEWRESLPRNPNGKYDRPKLAAELKSLFAEATQ